MHQHQISLFELPNYETDFTPNCWETPDSVAQRITATINSSDCHIIEPAAGTGQIAQFLPPSSLCCEIEPLRIEKMA